jgi:heme/copper-type cytochrome/quinol oxidase subunit 3
MLRISVYGSPYVYGIKQDNTSPVMHMLQCLIYSVLVLGISLDYNKDSIRESISSYDIVSYQMLCLLLIFILSENMFIMTNFWSSISAVYSSSTTTYNQTIQDHITQITNELTSTNTVLLSNCSLSLGSIFMINETHLLGYHINISGILISHLFSSCQIKEYQYLSLLMNESLTVTEFFILIGIHLCHVIVGIILITIYL